MLTACGSSTWYHMPGSCGAPVVHACSVNPSGARSTLWLAVATHVGSIGSARGSDRSSSGNVHITLRLAVADRTRVTSDAAMNDALLPKLFRMYEATFAIHES